MFSLHKWQYFQKKKTVPFTFKTVYKQKTVYELNDSLVFHPGTPSHWHGMAIFENNVIILVI